MLRDYKMEIKTVVRYEVDGKSFKCFDDIDTHVSNEIVSLIESLHLGLSADQVIDLRDRLLNNKGRLIELLSVDTNKPEKDYWSL